MKIPRGASPDVGWAFLDWPHPIPFAHRGGALDGAENALGTFQRAIDLGYRYLETDAHATADDVAVVFHDPALDRVTDRTGRIAGLPWSEVRKARIGGTEEVPRLEDVLDGLPDTRFNIDIKAPTAVAGVVRAVRRTNSYDRVCLASFVDGRVAAARRQLDRPVCTSLGRRAGAMLRLASFSPRARAALRVPAACVQLPMAVAGRTLVDQRLVRTAHDLGLAVHVWTLDTAEEITAALELGVDGVMTDAPAVLREVLLARGQWESP